MERKNINRSLPSLRMEDQGERSPQTFLVNNFSFLQPRRKQAPCAYYKCEFWNTDRGLKQPPGLQKTKMVMLNSPFSTIGKATAVINSNMRSCSKSRLWNFEHFVLLDKFTCLILNENLLLLKFLPRFFHLVAFIWEFKVLKVISIFPRSSLGFCIFNLLRPRGLFV